MNVNLTTLPCPRCGKPGPIEARICSCGQKFLRTSTSDEQYSLALVPPPEEPHERMPNTVPFMEARIRPRRVFAAFSTLLLAFVLTFIADNYLATDSSGMVDDVSKTSASLSADVQPSSVARPDHTANRPSVEATSNILRKVDQTETGTPPQNLTSDHDRRVQATVSRSEPTTAAKTIQRKIEQPDALIAAETARTAGHQAIPTARCTDGTYSYSTSAARACSERGGVAERLNGQHNGEPSLALNRVHQNGPRGGCFYVNTSGTKVYVRDKSLCGQD